MSSTPSHSLPNETDGPSKEEVLRQKRKIQSEKKRQWRRNLTPAQKERRQILDAQRKREQRMNQTPEQRAEARKKDAARKAAKRRQVKEEMEREKNQTAAASGSAPIHSSPPSNSLSTKGYYELLSDSCLILRLFRYLVFPCVDRLNKTTNPGGLKTVKGEMSQQLLLSIHFSLTQCVTLDARMYADPYRPFRLSFLSYATPFGPPSFSSDRRRTVFETGFPIPRLMLCAGNILREFALKRYKYCWTRLIA
ncbi:helitron helicase-like protein [Gracilaria domingensis]|nr:helitron helicase-like protein [Gracilaria domingensis]